MGRDIYIRGSGGRVIAFAVETRFIVDALLKAAFSLFSFSSLPLPGL